MRNDYGNRPRKKLAGGKELVSNLAVDYLFDQR